MAFFVNGELVADSVVRAEMDAIRQPLFQSMAGEDPSVIEQRVCDWARETVIDRVLLRQAALRETEPAPAEPLPARKICPTSSGHRHPPDDVEIRQRIAHFVDRLTAGVPPPADEEVATDYEKQRSSFAGGVVLHASHIVKHVHHRCDEEPAEREIRRAEAELQDGAAFADVADRYSDCPGCGGDLGWFRRGEMVDEFENALELLSLGGVSSIFRSPFGFHIAKLHDRQMQWAPSIDEVRDIIREMLHARAKERAVERFVDELRDDAEIRPTNESGALTTGAGA